MANSNPPKKGQTFTTYVALEDVANPGSAKANPTLAAGDVKVKKDAGSPANLATLPAVDNSAEIWVKVTLTGTEMNADSVCVQFIDQTSPKEWADFTLCILTTP